MDSFLCTYVGSEMTSPHDDVAEQYERIHSNQGPEITLFI